jgi:hypothetical protein
MRFSKRSCIVCAFSFLWALRRRRNSRTPPAAGAEPYLETSVHLMPALGQQLALEPSQYALRRPHNKMPFGFLQLPTFSSLIMPRSIAQMRLVSPRSRSIRSTLYSRVVTPSWLRITHRTAVSPHHSRSEQCAPASRLVCDREWPR